MSKLENLFSKVESPFTDEFIKELIKMYLDNNCDFNTMYSAINKTNIGDLQINEHVDVLRQVIRNWYNSARDSSGGDSNPEYDENEFWMRISSNSKEFEEYDKGDPAGLHLLYRIYLNVKGKDKLDCVMKYIEECHKKGLEFQFKYSTKDGRDDEIVIQSKTEDFLENISIIQEITQNMELGRVPMFVGKYGENIGITEEYYNRLMSPTQVRIHLLGAALIKYVCDHMEEALKLCTDEEKKPLEYIETSVNMFKEEAEEYKDFDDKLICGAKIDDVDRLTQNILNSDEMYLDGRYKLPKLNGIIRKMYELNPEGFLQEITSNVKYIGNNVFGISKDMIFSVTTENNIEACKKKDKIDRD